MKTSQEIEAFQKAFQKAAQKASRNVSKKPPPLPSDTAAYAASRIAAQKASQKAVKAVTDDFIAALKNLPPRSSSVPKISKKPKPSTGVPATKVRANASATTRNLLLRTPQIPEPKISEPETKSLSTKNPVRNEHELNAQSTPPDKPVRITRFLNPQPNPDFIKRVEDALRDTDSDRETPPTTTPKQKPKSIPPLPSRRPPPPTTSRTLGRRTPPPTTPKQKPKSTPSDVKVRSKRTGGSELGRKLMEIGTKVPATSNTPEGIRKRELLNKYKARKSPKNWRSSVFNNPDGN